LKKDSPKTGISEIAVNSALKIEVMDVTFGLL
jgi:hypothetical protein